MKNFIACLLAFACIASFCIAADPCSPAQPVRIWIPQDDPCLPRVLIIGDSISIGYTIPVRDELKGIANVHRIASDPCTEINGGPTKRGVQYIDQWLGTRKWDVIHFNFGLHDIRCTDPNGTPGLSHQVSPEQYRKNLELIVDRLEKTGARLIFATTTPVPDGAKARKKGDEVIYNKIAVQVMKKHKIAIDDLYSYALPRLAEIQLPKNVHFTDEGYKYLAKQVAKSIKSQLPRKKSK
jgi:acyl-CoA thioesterase-1